VGLGKNHPRLRLRLLPRRRILLLYVFCFINIKAVHCVAGLGRAPALVAIALIESGMSPLDTIEYVRRRRRGAFNTVQLGWLMETYKPKGKKSKRGIGFGKRPSSPTDGGNTPVSVAQPETAPVATSLFGRIAIKFKKSTTASSSGSENSGNELIKI
jgi:hypothetical protein